MKRGEDYEISLEMAQAPMIKVADEAKKLQPTASSGLRIWGINSLTKEYEMMVETAGVEQQDWKTYSFIVSPSKNSYDLLCFEPCQPLGENSKSGNLLIDNILPVIICRLGNSSSRVELSNPSFEDLPYASKTPWGWINYGVSTETPPDIQPGAFECMLAPQDGDSYLGLVVRDNDTWESVGQPLNVPLQRDSQYVFTAWLAKSALYMSSSKTTNLPANYATPVVLRIWGRNGPDDRELLATSPLVTNMQWAKSRFVLQPQKGNWKHLVLEAYYKDSKLFPYNGNLLIDKCSLSAIRN